jgi:hypothetical protein
MNKTNAILKWTATAILIIGTAVNGLGMYPEGPALLVIGGFIWLIVAIRIKDAPLIVTNLVMATVGLAAIIYTLHTQSVAFDAMGEAQLLREQLRAESVDSAAK